MKKILISLALLLLLLPTVHGQDISVSVTKPGHVYAGNVVEFEISIENAGADDWFSIAVFGTKPEWVTIEKPSVFIQSGKKVTTKVWISSSENAMGATYKYDIIVSRASDNFRIEKQVMVPILQKSVVVIDAFSLSCNLCKPDQNVSASVKLRNVGSRAVDNLKLLFDFAGDKQIIDVGTLEVSSEKTIVTKFAIGKRQPGNYEAVVDLLQDGNVLSNKSIQFSVEKVSNVIVNEKKSGNIFGRYVTIEIVNYGNTISEYQVVSKCAGHWYATYSGPRYQPSGDNCIWNVKLEPGERKLVKYSEIYWITILALLLIIVSSIYFYTQNTSLSIKKRVLQKYPAAEGRKYSISIEVANKGKSAENIIVRDKVPSMFAVERSFETVKPVVRKSETGTELVWKVGRLKSGEVRILHYKIKCLLGLLGVYNLPAAKLTGKVNGSHIVRKSNIVKIHGPKKGLK